MMMLENIHQWMRMGVALVFVGMLNSMAMADPTVLKVLVLENSPSMSYRNSKGELEGVSVELASMLCEKIKTRCELREVLLANMFDQLAAGEGDFSTSAVTATDERRQKVSFTEPVRKYKSFWLSKKSMEDSVKLRVAVVEGSTQQKWAVNVALKYEWTLVPVKTNADVRTAMLDGRADATVVLFATALSFAKDEKLGSVGFSNLQAIDDDTLSYESTMAVNPKNKQLLEQLNQALREIKSNGKLEALYSRHLSMRMR